MLLNITLSMVPLKVYRRAGDRTKVEYTRGSNDKAG